MLIDNRMDAAAGATRPYSTYLETMFKERIAAGHRRQDNRCPFWPDLRISDKQSGTRLQFDRLQARRCFIAMRW